MAARVGLFVGPLAALLTWVLLAGAVLAMPPAARATAAVSALMAIWWMTEAIPLAATALVPLVLFPLTGVYLVGMQQGDAVMVRQAGTGTIAEGTVVSWDDQQVTVRTDDQAQQYLPGELQVLEKEPPIQRAASPYASRFVFILMGGFMIALGIQRWGLHRRIALTIAANIGDHPAALVGGFMAAAAFLSMWVSNTATTMMLLPVALSVVLVTLPQDDGDDDTRNFAICMMLGVAYGASIGGLGTLIGSPPNALFAAYMAENHGFEIGFVGWMAVGLPLVVVLLPIAWFVLVRLIYPFRLHGGAGAVVVAGELRGMGPLSTPELRVALIFLTVAAMWICRPWLAGLPGLGGLSDAGIALLGGFAMFVVPARRMGLEGPFLMDWESAVKLPWGVLLLFGGGLSLASAVSATGLAAWIGDALGGLAGWPVVAVVLVIAGVVIFLTELTSNTATAAAFLPVVAALAPLIGLDPVTLALPAALAASCAYMLPVATPPNAIVYSSGHVSVPQMVRAGFILNLVAMGLIAALAFVWVPIISG